MSVPEPVLPAASVVVTDASMTRSASAVRSEPGTLIEKVLSGLTVPVNVLLLTVNVTTSPGFASPPTTPVTGIDWPDSAALMLSSGVMFASRVIVGAGPRVSMTTVSVAPGPGLPAELV